ncbi:MAG: DUF5662 family protein [Acutalibacteraceae bacterium]|nr:DUF5662 family protein [Acutalibacteraceae bacterium]
MKFFSHLRTVCRHRHCVIKHCYKAGILKRGLLHDLSKFSPNEFLLGVHYYLGTKSPNEAERTKKGYSTAWMHHKGRNKHHFEYWTDYSPVERKVMPVKMPLVYVAEMFCDRVAASKIYQGKHYTDSHPIEYFLRGKPNRFIHPETSDFLEMLLVMLSEKGEKETFTYLKTFLKDNKDY